jgi:hypothetical protein
VAFVEAARVVVVGHGDPVEPRVTVRRSVCQAGVEQRGAHATVAKGGLYEEVVHHQDAVGDQRVETRIQGGKALQPSVRVRDSLWSVGKGVR